MPQLGRLGSSEAKPGPYDVDEERRAANMDLAVKVITFVVFVGLINFVPPLIKSLK